MKRLQRHWINQPSTLQSCNNYHGKNVIINPAEKNGGLVTVYFTEGNITSALIPVLALSPGWKKK